MGANSDGRFQTRQMIAASVDADAGSTIPVATIKFATQSLVFEVSAAIRAAGTSAATHALDVYKGTDSIGSVAIGTNTIGAVVAAALADTTFAAGNSLIIKTTNSDATFKGTLLVDYKELFSAT
jgi:hypothetical protein